MRAEQLIIIIIIIIIMAGMVQIKHTETMRLIPFHKFRSSLHHEPVHPN
jgi:hypothetical protein